MAFHFKTAFSSAIPDIRNSSVDRSEAAKFRMACRKNELQLPTTSGHAPEHVQVNIVSLPKTDALEFLLFCLKNPVPCPILEVLEPGDPISKTIAPDADIRTDLPSYRIIENGEVMKIVPDATAYWRDDLVSFLIGCSFAWDGELNKEGLTPQRLRQKNVNIPCYETNFLLNSVGKFQGKFICRDRI